MSLNEETERGRQRASLVPPQGEVGAWVVTATGWEGCAHGASQGSPSWTVGWQKRAENQHPPPAGGWFDEGELLLEQIRHPQDALPRAWSGQKCTKSSGHKELGAAKVRAARTAGAQDLLREAANQGWNLRLSAVVLGWEVPACMTEALQPGAAVPRAFKRSHPRGHQLLGHPGSEEPRAVGASQTQAAL